MVQNDRGKLPGRPPCFDEADVVTKAVTTFWSGGYERTTLAALELSTGVDRSTIYNSFGGKRGLYNKAATEYLRQGQSVLFRPLTDGTSGLGDIVRFLDLLTSIQNDTATPPGCFIINDLASPANDEITARYLAILRDGLCRAIERSNRTDGTDPSQNEARVESLLAAVIGINLVHRRNPTSSRMVDGLRRMVRSWAEP